MVQTKQVEIDNSEAPDLQNLIDERNEEKANYQKLNFEAATANEDASTGYTNENLFDPAFKYHEYSRYDKFSNQNMTVLFYKAPYDDVYYSFKGNEDNGNFLKLEEQDAVNKATQDFLDKYITEGMSDYEKEMAIISFMVENIEYGYSSNASDIYGGLVLGKAQCGGYADTLAWLANAAGLNVLSVHGKAEGDPNYPSEHAWNLIRLDDKWYHVDVTWEDPIGQTSYGIGNLRNKYINLTDEEISADHTWEQGGLPICD